MFSVGILNIYPATHTHTMQDILPMLYLAMESSMSQVQMAAASAVPTILDFLCDDVIRVELVGVRSVYATKTTTISGLMHCLETGGVLHKH